MAEVIAVCVACGRDSPGIPSDCAQCHDCANGCCNWRGDRVETREKDRLSDVSGLSFRLSTLDP